MAGWTEKLRHNHLLMMAVCCAVPIIIVLIAVYSFGVSRSYLYWLVLLLCPLSHYFMMKDMHKDRKDEDKKDKDNEDEGKKGMKEGCH